MDFLYPTYDDPEFNIKIADKKEFNDLKTDQEIVDPELESERLCNMAFELRPHQQFVRNFMSINTPYNSLLLYHGLGTGKTCSAIGVCEEMRTYMKQANINKRIIIVASPNVQENFKLQLFDDRKLKQTNGLWNIEACSGKQFLQEINPTNMKNLKKERLLSQIARIIKNNYLFLGYIEFGNYIEKVMNIEKEGLSSEERDKLKKKKLERTFKNRLIVIDEVHNIRLSDDNKDKRIAVNLMKMIEQVDGTRLLLMSATPMYNSYKEIVWLLNLMNMNNGHVPIDESSIFDKQGNFVLGGNGEQLGRIALANAARGLVSFVRGDNPYTFPFRIYPHDFSKDNSTRSDNFIYPNKTINGKPIIQAIEYLDLFVVNIGSYQKNIYKKIVANMKTNQKKSKKEMPTAENMEKFGYTVLQKPLEALNMVYPQEKNTTEEGKNNEYELETMIGKAGLNRIMTHEMNNGRRMNYKYKTSFLKKFGKIFTKDLIGKYSTKIAHILHSVLNSEGIVLVYSQYLDGGLLPVALALEESGLMNYGGDSILKSPSVKSNKETALKYALITGDKTLSINNAGIVKAAGDDNNMDGSKIKVILVSRAGSEGLDFKNIRQVHIMEPWYNTNRIEQIIGRGVRNCSHKNLPFSKRNVMIFLYGTKLENDTEAADMYVYRVAEEKALKIGNVSRVLKETAVDCLLHAGQSGLTEERFNMKKQLELSNRKRIEYKIGDKKFSQLCDFMDSCEYSCVSGGEEINEGTVNTHTYDEHFIKDVANLKRSIKRLFSSHYFYKKMELLKILNAQHNTSLEQIYFALENMMNNPNDFLVDMYGRVGTLENIGDYYFYQPNELKHIHSVISEKNKPIDYKRSGLKLIKPKKGKMKEVNVDFDKTAYDLLLVKLQQNYDNTQSEGEVVKGDYDWFKHCANIYDNLENFGIDRATFSLFVATHIVDMLLLEEKLLLLNYFYYYITEDDNLSPFEKILKTVLDGKLLKEKGIFIQNKGITNLYIRGENAWKEAEKTDYVEMKDVLQKKISSTLPNLNKILGFVIEFKKSYFVFKSKNLKLKRHKGARCDQARKNDTIKTLMEILKGVESNEDMLEKMNNIELCAFMEFILRWFNMKKKENKVWFLEPEFSQLLKIEEYTQN